MSNHTSADIRDSRSVAAMKQSLNIDRRASVDIEACFNRNRRGSAQRHEFSTARLSSNFDVSAIHRGHPELVSKPTAEMLGSLTPPPQCDILYCPPRHLAV